MADNEPTYDEVLYLGRPVHYQIAEGAKAGQHRVAIVTGIQSKAAVNLYVFPNGPDDGYAQPYFVTNALWNDHDAPGTWSIIDEEESGVPINPDAPRPVAGTNIAGATQGSGDETVLHDTTLGPPNTDFVVNNDTNHE